ncbi:Spag1 [Symbiodinium sp. KB8]|nr:Spag1 [Symbiodinium sp. KB8]
MSAVTGEENQQENQQGEWNQELSPDDEWYYDDLTWDESDRNSEWIGSVDDWSGDWSWYDDDWSSWPEDWSWNTQDWWTPEAQVSSNGAASSGANVLQDIAKNQPPQKVSAVRSVTNADSECPDHGTEPTRFDDSLVEFHMQVGQTEALYRREWNETTGPLLSVLLPDTRAEGLTACRFGHPDLRCNGPASSLRTRMSSLAINAELNGQNNLLIESSWVTMTNRAIGGGLECDCSSWDEIYEDEENTANAWNGSNNRNLANVMAIAQTANAREPGAENVLRKNTDLVYGPDASPLPPGDWGDLDWGSPVLDDWGWGAPASGEWGADPVSDGGASGAQVSRKLHILGSSEVQALQLQASAKVSDLLEQLREEAIFEEEAATEVVTNVTEVPEAHKKHMADSEKEKGNEAFYSKDFSEAEAYYSRSLQYQADDASAWANRALVRLKLSNFQGALEDCEHALALNGTHVKALHRKGKALYELQRFADAAGTFRSVLELR